MEIRRIMHIIPTLEGGGAERQLSYLAPKLVEKGWDVHIALFRLGVNFKRLLGSGVKIHLVPYRNHYDPLILWRLYRLIRCINPDLVQTWLLMANITGGLAAIMARKPWVLSERCRSNYSLEGAWGLVKMWLGGIFSKAIVANSATGCGDWQRFIGIKKHISVIPNGLPIKEIIAVKAKDKHYFNLSEDQGVVLYAGRFDEQKNLVNLTVALARVLEKNDAFAFLCGDGPMRGRVQTIIRTLGMENWIFLMGYVDDLWALMKAANVFVSVSFYEGMPNVLMEAMVCGCPLVVSNIPEHRELLDNESALFVNPLDPDDIASAIEECLFDRHGALKRAKRAKEAAMEWTIDRMADQYIDVYRNVLLSRV